MYIVVIAWVYVVFMMSIAEHSVVAGVMTFLLYGLAPLTIILYVSGTSQRRRARAARENSKSESLAEEAGTPETCNTKTPSDDTRLDTPKR